MRHGHLISRLYGRNNECVFHVWIGNICFLFHSLFYYYTASGTDCSAVHHIFIITRRTYLPTIHTSVRVRKSTFSLCRRVLHLYICKLVMAFCTWIISVRAIFTAAKPAAPLYFSAHRFMPTHSRIRHRVCVDNQKCPSVQVVLFSK